MSISIKQKSRSEAEYGIYRQKRLARGYISEQLNPDKTEG